MEDWGCKEVRGKRSEVDAFCGCEEGDLSDAKGARRAPAAEIPSRGLCGEGSQNFVRLNQWSDP